MAFDLLQRARFGARPVRLYRFQFQDAIWWYAQADRDIETPGGTTWAAAQIERDEIKQTAERAQDKLKIRMAYLRNPYASPLDIPVTQPLGDLWHPYIPSDRVKVMCFDWMYGDTDPPRMAWSGEVADPTFTDVQLELTCEPWDSIGEAKGQGPKSQRACPKVPYSTGKFGCHLDPEDFTVAGTVTAIAGLTLTVPEFAAAPLSLLQGEFKWQRSVTAHNGVNAITERRTIMAHDGASVTLLYGGLGLGAASLACSGLPGCEGTWDACDARDNTINHGGAPQKPVKNPYDGQALTWG